MSSVLQSLFGGQPGGAVGGNVIVPGNYDPTKRGTAKVGSGLIKPTRNMGPASGAGSMNASAAAGGGGGNAAAAPAATSNMGETIIPGGAKTSLTGTSAGVEGGNSWFGLGKLFGGRRRKSRRAKKAKKAKKTRRAHKRKSHRRRR